MEHPPGSRLFVVCGKSADVETLWTAFQAYGNVQHIKLVPQKGVAFVKVDKASSAALAMENLDRVVLNHGRGPRLKVLLAEPLSSRDVLKEQKQDTDGLFADPDNLPLRSRLFLAVPRSADGSCIKAEMSMYFGLEYCKTDLISSKGVVFAKFSKASAALRVLESINETSRLAGYRVACMLAKPKVNKVHAAHKSAMATPSEQHPARILGNNPDYVRTSSFSMGLSGGTLLGNPDLSMGVEASPSTAGSPLLSRQRLFVVVHKTVTEDMLARIFRALPGMEYCDLKKERKSGRSKGYAYVNYSTHEAALAAIHRFSGIEVPAQSGHHLRVMFARLLGVNNDGGPRMALGPLISQASISLDCQRSDNLELGYPFVDDCDPLYNHGGSIPRLVPSDPSEAVFELNSVSNAAANARATFMLSSGMGYVYTD